jgi:IS605 OrfB family transposase
LNNKVLFKPFRIDKIEINLPKVKKSINNQLLELQRLSDNKEITISVKLSKKNISFTFDESKLQIYKKFENLKQNRVLGIDLNPDYLGISILEFDKDDKFKVIKKMIFDLKKLNTKQISSNKRKFENIEICHTIIKLCNEFKVSKLVLEDLSINTKDLKVGKHVNRKVNNVWIRNLVRNKLKMLCINFGVEYVEVLPYYSSQIGNIVFGDDHTPDMIASSIELARRGYKKFQKNWFYPNFEYYKDVLNEQWKQTLVLNNISCWKELFLLIKNSKLKYRILIDEAKEFCQNSFRRSSYKSKVNLYCYS